MQVINREIIQSYILTSAKYDFTADEKRVLTKLVEMFQPMLNGKKLEGKISQDLFNTYHLILPISSFMTDKQKYTRVRDAFFSLNDKKFIYADDEVEEVIRIVEMPKIFKRGEIQFALNPKIVQCFLNMSKGYSKYELEVSLSFQSVYAMRLYELISGQEHSITFKIDTLKQMFGVADKYKKNGDFVKRVIDTAQRELNEKSPVSFTYKINKKGKSFFSIQFNPIIQPSNQDANIEFSKLKKRVNPSLVIGKELRNYLKNTCDFTETEIKNNLELFAKCVEIYGDEILTDIRNIQVRSRKAKNPKGYIINALKSKLNK